MAADLAIQQENEGLRLALREQERIVEELTNECRRLEDRLEDRYQDIDALRRELDRGERALKQAEERSSQLVGDSGTPAAGAASAASAPKAQAQTQARDGQKSIVKPAESTAGGRGALGFGAGLLAGAGLMTVVLAVSWLMGLVALGGQTGVAPEVAGPAAPSRPPPTETGKTVDAPAVVAGASDAATLIDASRATLDRDATAARSDSGPREPGSVSEDAALADQGQVSAPAAAEVAEDLRVPAEPVAGTHVDRFLAGEMTAPEMVVLESSEFMMGNPVGMADSDARPVHKVSLDAFMIGAREVTFADYDRFVRETGARRPQDYGWGRGSRPVIDVSWDEARAYTQWLSEKTGQHYRLPSEAEWEYAARGGAASSFWWGIGSPASRALCVNCGTRWDQISTAPVGSFAPNPFGLYDTAGNVYEWTADCYHHSYQGSPGDGSAREDPGCERRVARGGSFKSPASAMRSHARNRFSSAARVDMLGFRVARDLDVSAVSADDG